MPIKDRSIYPGYWKQFSEYIRFERAGNMCEFCGIPNKWKINDGGSRVVLTVAHLDNEGGVCDCLKRHGRKCANPDHVKALCQKCHNRLDGPARRENANRTLARKHDGARPLLNLN